jgi:hypothetical protein
MLEFATYLVSCIYRPKIAAGQQTWPTASTDRRPTGTCRTPLLLLLQSMLLLPLLLLGVMQTTLPLWPRHLLRDWLALLLAMRLLMSAVA